jgi:hypothetical protein
MPQPQNFVDLNAAFYNAFMQGLGFSNGDGFQIIQPAVPIPSGDQNDQTLWNYANMIPPFSTTHNTILSAGNQFLSDYQAVMSALLASPNNVAAVMGASCWAAYQKAISSGDVKPGNAAAFRKWALVNQACSAVANSGASALAAALLDPIFAAQQNVSPYLPAGTEAVDFAESYKMMVKDLAKAPSRKFDISESNWNWDLKSSWASSNQGAFFGLWGSSSSSSSTSQKFAAGGVSVKASFDHVLSLTMTPGVWYTSSVFGLAFNTKTGRPWDSTKPFNWNNTFASPNGNMQRFLATLIIISGMNVTVQSNAQFTEAEQTTIHNSSGGGLWPFYNSSSDSGATTNVGFNANGNMTVTFSSAAGVPVLVGCTVLSAAAYLGHETQASLQLANMVGAKIASA